MTNLFAYRSTDPRGLLAVADPVGPGNDDALLAAAGEASPLAAWGAYPLAGERGKAVVYGLHMQGIEVLCLGLTKGGQPRHPLYVRADTRPIPFRASAPAAGDEGGEVEAS